MAYLRFSRDTHGYEHFQLVEPLTRRGRTRPRVLYWFRSPPGVKVGRDPFDDETRRALEARYPSVAFDWRRIVDTPIPSDAEKWRERRREERAARRAKKTRDLAPSEREPESRASEPDRPGESDDVEAGDAGEPPDPSADGL